MKSETCPTDENSFKLMHSHAPSYFNKGDVKRVVLLVLIKIQRSRTYQEGKKLPGGQTILYEVDMASN